MFWNLKSAQENWCILCPRDLDDRQESPNAKEVFHVNEDNQYHVYRVHALVLLVPLL
jgi:hypothetical protein